MAAAFVQAKATVNNTNATTIAATWDSNTTTGNLIALYVQWAGTTVTISSITDSQSNTYTLIAAEHPSNRDTAALYYATNITGGTTPTVTVTFSATIGSRRLIIHEASGLATSSPFDQYAINYVIVTAADFSTSSRTTTADGEYIFGGTADLGYTSTATAVAPFTQRIQAAQGTTSEDQIQATAGSVAATFHQNGTSIEHLLGMATFKVPAAVTLKGTTFSLMGVG